LTDATLTAIAWDAEDFDTDVMHDNSTNNTRLVCTLAGKYRVYCSLAFAPGAVGERAVVFKVNNSTYVGGQQVTANATTADHTVVSATTTCDLAVGDYVECLGQQITGGSLNVAVSSTSVGIPSHFGMERIG
jgi:hypothetical protein